VGDRAGGGTASTIYVIGNASTANTPVTPVRSITDASTGDRKFVSSTRRTTCFTPGRTIHGFPVTQPGLRNIFLDTNRDRLFIGYPWEVQ
jgi:hypothetical protein